MTQPLRIIALGDSITKGYEVPEGWGWVDLLSRTAPERLGRPVTFINAGGNGNTSAEGLQRFDRDVLPHLPGIVLIEFGGNDAVDDQERHVPPDQFYQNLKAMIGRTRNAGGHCVLITFPVIIDEQHMSYRNPYFQSRGGIDQVVHAYRHLTRVCAKEMNLPLIDLDELSRHWIECDGRSAIVTPDGIHWTIRANERMADAVLEHLKSDGPLPETCR